MIETLRTLLESTTTARRQSKLAAKRAELARLQQDMRRAAAEDDDTTFERLSKRVPVLQAEADALAAALRQAEDDEAAAKERAAAEAQAALEDAAVGARQAYLDDAMQAERRLQEFAEVWRAALRSFDVAMAAERAANGGKQARSYMQERGLVPGRLWTRVFLCVMRDLNRDVGSPLLLPSGAGTHGLQTVADYLAQHEPSAAADPQQNGEE